MGVRGGARAFRPVGLEARGGRAGPREGCWAGAKRAGRLGKRGGGRLGQEKKEGFSIFGLSTKECHKMDSKRGFKKGTK